MSEYRYYESNSEYSHESHAMYTRSLHRTNGPARCIPDQFFEWYIDGVYICIYEYDQHLRKCLYYRWHGEQLTKEEAELLFIVNGGESLWPTEKEGAPYED